MEEANIIAKGLSRLTPINIETPNVRVVNENECVKSSNSTCILGKTDNSNYFCNWSGSLPSKCMFTRLHY